MLETRAGSASWSEPVTRPWDLELDGARIGHGPGFSITPCGTAAIEVGQVGGEGLVPTQFCAGRPYGGRSARDLRSAQLAIRLDGQGGRHKDANVSTSTGIATQGRYGMRHSTQQILVQT